MDCDGLVALFEKIEKNQDLETNMGKAVALVEGAAKQKAPKGTGALRRSIESRVDTNNGEVEGVVFSTLEYAPYVEYGTGLYAEQGGRKSPWRYEDDNGEWHTTRGQHPSPYLRPALEENRDNILKLLKEGIL